MVLSVRYIWNYFILKWPKERVSMKNGHFRLIKWHNDLMCLEHYILIQER